MMYQSKVVVAVKVGGKVLREFGDTVRMPFGSEYSVYIKNLQSGRIKCRVTIDGHSITDGIWLVVPSFQSIDLERFIQDSNLAAGRKLKFIERTAEIEAHRGVGAEDGLIQVEFQREVLPTFYPGYPQSQLQAWSGFAPATGGFTANYLNQCNAQASNQASQAGDSREMMRSRGLTKSSVRGSSAGPVPVNEAGITVGGAKSSQQFASVSDFVTGPSESVVLRLVGGTEDTAVIAPVLVTTKIRCAFCGKRSKSSAEYCSKCSAALHSI